MHFDNIETNHKYLSDILFIIREGIRQKKEKLHRNKREGLNTQLLAETFNIIGTTNKQVKTWIGVQKEHERNNGLGREDIYFHLNDDNHTRIFYMEAKRLPKYKTKNEEEYVFGTGVEGKKSGGIQRYKILVHGNLNSNYNGMVAYVETQTIDDWLLLVNNKLKDKYPTDTALTPINYDNEYTSLHKFENYEDKTFTMHHFWIDLQKE
ncbi:hypothetical protein [Flavobacterium lindanitolerans]|jgi:hypothetical protein|uniref:hypothetical protein n=1 Tax=Flavobacterium lindanitolerans TaxID=428988 RepID=UPI000DB4219D|nr:hypothetical protein [Flavobacterium lindanitolerans]PZO25395.1 MAG: hypothetical protein DCE86_15615 [Flavobacteriaceae bacterium]THD34147.1 MAG: hypothetical protein DI588_03120 [Flavobacterium johnsoniae]